MGVSHYPAFIGNCQTISDTFIVDEGNKNAWGKTTNLEFRKLSLGTKKCAV